MRSDIHRTRLYVPLAVIAVSLALLAWAYVQWRESKAFLSTAIRTPGKVTRIEIQQDNARVVKTPGNVAGEIITDPAAYETPPETQITYKDNQGREEVLHIPTSDSGLQIGSLVEVGYDPRDPGAARVLTFSTLYTWPTGLAAIGASGLLGAFILLLVSTQRKQRRPM